MSLYSFGLEQFIFYEHNALSSWPVGFKVVKEQHEKMAEAVKFCAYVYAEEIEKYFLAELVNLTLAEFRQICSSC